MGDHRMLGGFVALEVVEQCGLVVLKSSPSSPEADRKVDTLPRTNDNHPVCQYTFATMDIQNPAAEISRDTLVSLEYLDPSPVPDSRPGSISIPAPDPNPPPKLSRAATFASSLGLSGNGHSSFWYCKFRASMGPERRCQEARISLIISKVTRLQKYSSYAFTVFAAFHITNTSIIPLITRSVSDSETYLLLTRPYYQSALLEPLLITIPITTHILAGLALRINRRNANLKRYGAGHLPISKRLEQRLKVWPAVSWSSMSGYILTPLVVGHAFVNRTLPWIYEGGSSDVGLGYVSHGFAKHPFLAWTGYAALVGVGVGHFVWGVAKWQNWAPVGNDKKAKRRWWTINGIAIGIAALWMAGGLGVVGRGGMSDGWVGKGYDVMYSRVPLLKL